MKLPKQLVIYSSLLLHSTLAAGENEQDKKKLDDSVYCPKLHCFTMGTEQQKLTNPKNAGESNECFKFPPENDGSSTSRIFARECYNAEDKRQKGAVRKFCPFEAYSGKYAWNNELLQSQKSQNIVSDGNPLIKSEYAVSENGQRMTSASCKEVLGLRQNLLPGRTCQESFHCRSSMCNLENICRGKLKDANCFENQDCDASFFCRKSDVWPFPSLCSKLKSEYDECLNDYECQNQHFCWFPDSLYRANNKKICLSLYSQDEGHSFGWGQVYDAIDLNYNNHKGVCKTFDKVAKKILDVSAVGVEMLEGTDALSLQKCFEVCEDNQTWDDTDKKWIKRDKAKPCTGFAMIDGKCMQYIEPIIGGGVSAETCYVKNVQKQEWKEYEQNGKYCASGLARKGGQNEAVCTKFKEMKWDGATVPEPFECNPSQQNKKCQLFYDAGEGGDASTAFVENQCKCAMNGNQNIGYCSLMIGTEKYRNAVSAKVNLLGQSKCHTMDRHNWRAQRDICGVPKSDQWRFAVDQMFNMTYWPLIQDSEKEEYMEDTDMEVTISKYHCIRMFFSDSYDSLVLDKAMYGVQLSLILASYSVFSQL